MWINPAGRFSRLPLEYATIYYMLWRLLVVLLLGLTFLWLVGMKIVARIADLVHFAAPCPASLGWVLNSPFRRCYLRKTPDRIGFQAGERVLELGPGVGVFTEQAAYRVGAQGLVLAVDIQLDMARQLARRVQNAGLANVRILVADAEFLPLAHRCFDRAFAISVMAEVRGKSRAFRELYRVLHPGGVLSITEEFIDPDYPFPWETRRRAMSAGFHFLRHAGGVWTYTINFTRPLQEQENVPGLI